VRAVRGEMNVVDAHHHLWDPARRAYPWMAADPLAPLRRPFTVDDLRAATGGRVTRTVLVQTVSDRLETAEFLATAAASDGLIAGVVGWVDLTAPDVAEQIARLRAGSGGELLVGVRHQAQDEPDPEWLLRPDVRRGIAAVGAAGLAYDLLVLAHQLPVARQVGQRLPQVRFVLDHLAKPPIAAGAWQPWAQHLAELAELPNVSVKLSGLVTEAVWDDWDAERIGRYARHALRVFGPRRCMFGSDWPVCTVAGSYAGVLDAAQAFVDDDPVARAAVFSGTAQRVYGLADR
jgi:L-fucono-1,5-lactonase